MTTQISDTPYVSWNLPQWLAWLEACHPTEIELGLGRIRKVAEQLQLGRPAKSVVTVAGTNGKGSTIAYLERMLRDQGKRVGCYTSPHFLHYNERVRLNGRMVDDASLCAAFRQVEAARLALSPAPSLTYFEYGTLAALQLFEECDLDVALLEVGLGGRLDAVNLVDPDIAVITTVDLDHQDWLGSDREVIGREKAGILRAGVPLVYGEADMPDSVREQAEAFGCPLFQFGSEYVQAITSDSWHWQGRSLSGQLQELHDLPFPQLPAPNAATALQVFSLLGLPLQAQELGEALRQARLTGRMQRVQDAGVPIILDVAHNGHAARHLADCLAGEPCSGRTLAVLGMLADKHAEPLIEALVPEVSAWFLGGLPGSRGRSAQSLAQAFPAAVSAPVVGHATIEEAYQAALAQAAPEDRILVLGSFVTLAQVLECRGLQAASEGEVSDAEVRTGS